MKDPQTGEIVEVRAPTTRPRAVVTHPMDASQIHHPLGLRGPRRGSRSAPLRHPLLGGEPRRRSRGQDFTGTLNPASLGDPAGVPDWSPHWRKRSRAHATSSNGWVTSVSIPRIPLPGAPVFNRTVTLKDTWAKIEKEQGKK